MLQMTLFVAGADPAAVAPPSPGLDQLAGVAILSLLGALVLVVLIGALPSGLGAPRPGLHLGAASGGPRLPSPDDPDRGPDRGGDRDARQGSVVGGPRRRHDGGSGPPGPTRTSWVVVSEFPAGSASGCRDVVSPKPSCPTPPSTRSIRQRTRLRLWFRAACAIYSQARQ